MNDSPVVLSHRQGLALLLALIALLSSVIYWDFLTFSHLFLYKDIGSDTLNVFYPKYVHLADYLRTEGWPGWSFSQGMGQNIFPHSIGNPFELLLMLMGSERLAYGLVYIEVLKISLSGLFFYLYLRVLSISVLTSVIGGLLYAFSGFMILGGTWYVFSVEAVYFALLLYVFERYLKDGVWLYFPIAVALVLAGMSFSLYLFTLFLLPYGIFRYYVVYGWHPKAALIFFLKMIGLALVGVAISAMFLFSNVQEMMNSPRVLGESSFFDKLMGKPLFGFEGFVHNVTAIMRLFSNDLIGTGSDFRGWYNYLEAPIFYCGLLSLLLAPQVFITLERKYKITYALFGLVFLVPVIIPFFRYMFWAFAGNYYRLFSLFVAFVLISFCLHALDRIFKSGKVHVPLLLTTLAILLGLLFYPYVPAEDGAGIVDGAIRMMVVVLLLLYACLMMAMKSERLRGAAQWGVLLVVCVELMGFSWQTVNDRSVLTAEEYEARTGYNDYSVDAVAWIKQKDPGFYRIEKTYGSGPAIHASINDAKVQSYYGTSSYHSFNQLNYIRFLDALGIVDGGNETATRWASGLVNKPLLLTFSSVRYVLAKRSDNAEKFVQFGYRIMHEVGDIVVLMNPFYLPFGFTYDSYMTEADFLLLSAPLKRIALMKAAVLGVTNRTQGEQLLSFDLAGIKRTYSSDSYVNDVKARREAMLRISSHGHNQISGSIELSQPKMLFFTLPFDQGWSVTVNGAPAELKQVNIGFSGVMLEAGAHEIVLSYDVPYMKVGMVISIISLLVFMLCVWRFRPVAKVKVACG